MGHPWKHSALIMFAVMFVVSHARADFSLLVSVGEDKEPVLCLPLKEGARFHLDFINSIYLAPVRETFEYEPRTGISLVGVESPSPGVFEYYGLMTEGAGKAALRRVLGEHIRLLSHEYRYHRLSADGREIALNRYAVNGRPLLIQARRGNHCAAGR